MFKTVFWNVGIHMLPNEKGKSIGNGIQKISKVAEAGWSWGKE
jgi:hypothetical protein